MSLVTNLAFIDQPVGHPRFESAEIQLHDHLTDNADWNAEYWEFDDKYLQSYAQLLQRLFLASASGIEFSAIWVGDKPTKVVELAIEGFLELVRSNRIGTRTRYVVHRNA